jgi:tripartite-type tricarboxylate transporter receptor subunit TctC
MSGQVQLYFMNVTQSVPLVAAKKLRALGVSTPERSPIAPDIPTIAEGGVKGYDMTNWYGLLAPATTPRTVVASINTEVKTILGLPDTRKQVAATGMVIEATSADQFATFLKNEAAKYLRVIETAGIKGTL